MLEKEVFKIVDFLKNTNKVLVLRNGVVVRNLYDLRLALKYMDPSIYYNHANSKRNDFVNWVEIAVGDISLAKSMRSARNAKELFSIVDKRIEFLTSLMLSPVLKVSESRPEQVRKPEAKLAPEEDIDFEKLSPKVKAEIIRIEEEMGNERFKRGIINFIIGIILGLLFGFLLGRM
ncbi:hypothetical protein COT07_03675 [Candidatus Woesearchaeota archaeon CG07_land_8_20_14_0_80_44_23]|nr:MAG: hypothetical protein COT07_03675 [Candidatus Woesearchaeota archaeon CG07_land_8_20_14_0_80_44_23]